MNKRLDLTHIIKPIIFCIVFFLVFELISPLFKVQDFRVPQIINGFYDEPKDSIDAIFVGASNSYAAWQPPLAYDEFGFTSYTLAFPHLPNTSIVHYIDEARKTQPNALYVVALNGFTVEKIQKEHFHHSLDYLPMSLNKHKMIRHLEEDYELEPEEVFALYVPFYQFHSGWDQLEKRSFSNPQKNLKGAQIFGKFLRICIDEHYNYVENDAADEVTPSDKKILDDIISYCTENDVNVTFISFPQALVYDRRVTYLNGVEKYLTDAGFDVIDLMTDLEDRDLDLTYDFYNFKHTNIHGSIKLVHYVGKYLQDKYSLPSSHSKKIEENWEDSYTFYRTNYLNNCLVDFEWEHAPRDLSVPAPENLSLTATDKGFSLTWEPSEGADGYVVYRKYKGGTGWERIADTQETSLKDTVKGLLYKTDYTYALAPYRNEGGKYIYGQFDYNGKVCTSVKKPSDPDPEPEGVEDEAPDDYEESIDAEEEGDDE